MLGNHTADSILAKLREKNLVQRKHGLIEPTTDLELEVKTPPRVKPGYYQYQGKTWTLQELMAHSAVSKSAFIQRIGRGWSVEDALKLPASETAQQRKHAASTTLYEINGEKLNSCQVAAKYKVERQTFIYRIKAGWSVEDAVNTPAYGAKRRTAATVIPRPTYIVDNVAYTLPELYEMTTINRSTIYSRIANGWDPKEAITLPAGKGHRVRINKCVKEV